MIDEDILGEHNNNVDPVTDRTYAQTVDTETGNGLAKAAIGGVVGAVLGTMAVALANKKTAGDINRSVKGVGNAVKDAAGGVNFSIKNAVEAVKGAAKSVINETVKSTASTVQSTTEDVNETVKSAASKVQAPVAAPQPPVNTAMDMQAPVADSQPPVNNAMDMQAPVADSQPVDEQGVNLSDTQLFKLYEERLVANKKQVKTGEVAIGKHVETHKARISVPVEKERLVIEQLPVKTETPVAPGEADFYERELVRVEIYEEKADIQKQPFVREQVSVRKEVEHDTFEVEDDIRREELDLDVQGRNIIAQGDNYDR
jgi:uncharacterized protein (TIGR02271 family)